MKTKKLFLWLAIAAVAALVACTKPENQSDSDPEVPEQPKLPQAVDTVYEWLRWHVPYVTTSEELRSKLQVVTRMATEKEILEHCLFQTVIDTMSGFFSSYKFRKISVTPQPQVVNAQNDTIYVWEQWYVPYVTTPADLKSKLQVFTQKTTEKEILNYYLYMASIDINSGSFVSYKFFKIGVASQQ